MEFSLSKPQTVSYWCVHSDSEEIGTLLYKHVELTLYTLTNHSNILAGDSKASNLQTEISKVGDISQGEKFFTELENALDKEEMDDEAFVDKLGYEIEFHSCKSTLTLI